MGIIKILSTGTSTSSFVTGSISVQSNGTAVGTATNINFINFNNITFSGSTVNVSTSGPYDISIYVPTVLSSSQQIVRIDIPRPVTFANNFAPSLSNSGASATSLTKLIIAQNGTTVGTITFPASSSTGTITSASSSTVFNAGDILTITGPATADATLAQISITLSGTR